MFAVMQCQSSAVVYLILILAVTAWKPMQVVARFCVPPDRMSALSKTLTVPVRSERFAAIYSFRLASGTPYSSELPIPIPYRTAGVDKRVSSARSCRLRHTHGSHRLYTVVCFMTYDYSRKL